MSIINQEQRVIKGGLCPVTKRLLSEMETSEKKNVTKISFFSAAVILSDLCDKIDTAEDVDEVIRAEFFNACSSLEDSIDRRKFVMREAESKIELARSYKKNLDEMIKRLQRVQERITENTKKTMEITPNIPFKDSLGNKLSIRKNSQPHLVLAVDLRESKAVSNILDDASIALLEIDPKYIKTISYMTLDTEMLKRDLQAGIAISWASLHWGSHLRGLK